MAIDFSSAPQLNFPTTRQERKDLGIGEAYVDSYIQGQTAQYNNQYNAWLLNQQLEYNSPKNQVERLKEAGLNPNFNSIDGTGNMSPVNATSSANINSSVAKNESLQFQNTLGVVSSAIDVFNSFIGAIGQGVTNLSKLSGIPADVPSYRAGLNQILNTMLRGKKLENTRSLTDTVFQIIQKGGNHISPLSMPEIAFTDDNGKSYVLQLAPHLSNQMAQEESTVNLRNSATAQNLARLPVLSAQKELIDEQRKLYGSKNTYQEKENDWYEVNNAIDAIQGGISILGSMFGLFRKRR